MALLRKWNIGGGSNDENGIENILPGMSEKIQQDLERVPPLQVLDFLLQYFINELNWMKQIVHRPSFVAQYQQWCSKAKPLSVVRDVEFTVLILRICAYSAQFLPSPSETIDRIGGLSLCSIRKLCSELGESLAETCLTLDWKGSVIRVQHVLFAALISSCEGKTGEFWERIGLAGQAAQKAGLEAEIPASGAIPGQDWETETRSRLDRVPFLSDNLVARMMASLRLIPEPVGSTAADASAPDEFMVRLMQVQLGRFWRSCWPNRSEQYDPTQGEHRYERFCTEYLPTLTPAFALEPDTRWDKHFPKLSMQRQLLHIAIFDSVCWNFRPLLLLTAAQLAGLPAYKRVLIQSQRERLATAALRELEAVSALHSMFGGSQIRSSAIIFNTFEAAVLLLCLSSQTEDSQFCQEEDGTEILGVRTARPSRAQMMQAVETALRRLKMLSEVSEMAASGTKVVGELLNQGARDAALPPTTGSSSGSGWPGTVSNLLGTNFDSDMWISSDESHENLMNELLSNIGNQESGPEFQFPYNYAMP
ncbi:hypothetical protein Daus18300_005011 [Diaporthe australafricana]|uniref:Transcription factor domain-containing protein n=1 Tax=Diaporthe australafricana TaxID=127596 RepID=A0ABR3X421_9PEZI